ncbi:MAG: tetratricopeptide repeat protein [Nitrososphaerales archaeon]
MGHLYRAIALRRYPGRIGSIYYALGDFSAALQYFQLGLEAAKKAKDEDLEALLQIYIGDVFVAQYNTTEAIACYKRAVEINEKLRRPSYLNSAFDSLSALYIQMGEYQKAKEMIQRELNQARETSYVDKELVLLNRSGELHLRLNEAEQAIKACRAALQLAMDKNSPRHAWTAYAGLAMAYGKLGQFDKAREYYRLAINIMEKVRANLGGEEEKAGFFRDKVKVYKDLVAALMQLHGRDATKRYDAEAFHFAERGRARAFLDLLGEAKNVEQGIDPDLLERQHKIEAGISKLNTQLINERSKEPGKQDKAKIKESEEALSKADAEHGDWLRELRRRNPHYADLKYPEPLKLEEAQQTLGDHSLILAYSLGEQEAFLFAVGRNEYLPARLKASAAEIRDSVGRLSPVPYEGYS